MDLIHNLSLFLRKMAGKGDRSWNRKTRFQGKESRYEREKAGGQAVKMMLFSDFRIKAKKWAKKRQGC
jgi:hypothetical protein